MSANARLKEALFEARLTPEELAEKIAVDPKTVQRWLAKGRTPYPKHQHSVAVALGVRERELWPDAAVTVSEELRRAIEYRQPVAVESATPSRSYTPPAGWQDDGTKPHEGWMFEYETLPDGRTIRGEVLISTVRDPQLNASTPESNSLATVHESLGIDRQPDASMRALMSWIPDRDTPAEPEMQWGGFDR
ncbi:helix-turn-helix transcriptional regulator [Nocardia wallacei]|uniref:helix-turn-helix transcriptional regulator n=1 Tax=Nocardia wallacei TaxID=480035 RepID=UPI002456495E|nr:helix-turn-helix transcriptional regulator [Nocardia wallacei]